MCLPIPDQVSIVSDTARSSSEERSSRSRKTYNKALLHLVRCGRRSQCLPSKVQMGSTLGAELEGHPRTTHPHMSAFELFQTPIERLEKRWSESFENGIIDFSSRPTPRALSSRNALVCASSRNRHARTLFRHLATARASSVALLQCHG